MFVNAKTKYLDTLILDAMESINSEADIDNISIEQFRELIKEGYRMYNSNDLIEAGQSVSHNEKIEDIIRDLDNLDDRLRDLESDFDEDDDPGNTISDIRSDLDSCMDDLKMLVD